ncbi:hypothetical protein [Pseudomonas sp. 10-1B]|uniref:hypothetical protein n=1 Tax=Pseudomonas sp. 10-1B TaxID=1546029 RepID=UPI000B33DE7D|nr:hypothetical protein [Pseudomonas sp. 10-1B]
MAYFTHKAILLVVMLIGSAEALAMPEQRLKLLASNTGVLEKCGDPDIWRPKIFSMTAATMSQAETDRLMQLYDELKVKFGNGVSKGSSACTSREARRQDVERYLKGYSNELSQSQKSKKAATTGGLGTIPTSPTPLPPGAIGGKTIPVNVGGKAPTSQTENQEVNIDIPGVGGVKMKVPKISIGIFGNESNDND